MTKNNSLVLTIDNLTGFAYNVSSDNFLFLSSQDSLNVFENAFSQVRQYLRHFATEPDFLSKMQTVFGDNFTRNSALGLSTAWAKDDFASLPQIEIRSSQEINGALGAFSKETNRIYLAKEFVRENQSYPEIIAQVLLEEIGHFVDSRINVADTLGDEGEFFTALVQGQTLSAEQIQQLKTTNDTATVTIDGQVIEIEQACPSDPPFNPFWYFDKYYGRGEGVGDGGGSPVWLSQGYWPISIWFPSLIGIGDRAVPMQEPGIVSKKTLQLSPNTVSEIATRYIRYYYNMYSIPDTFILRFEGRDIVTGYVGSGWGIVEIKGNSDELQVIVETNDADTDWVYFVEEVSEGENEVWEWLYETDDINNQGRSKTLQLDSEYGRKGRLVEYNYEMYDEFPDQFILIYEEEEIFNTGYVLGSTRGIVEIPEGNSDELQVIVKTNHPKTAWS